MKKILLVSFAALLGLVSCQQEKLAPLSGKFPVATQVNDITSVSATSVKAETGRAIDVDLKSGSSTIHIAFLGNKYYLTENIYSEAMEAVAQPGKHFIAAKTTVNGLKSKSGQITVLREAVDTEKKTYSLDDVYTIKGVLFLDDASAAPVTFKWSGKLAFYPDPIIGDIVVENALTETVTDTDAGMKKHLFTLTDGDGNPAGCFEIFVSPEATTVAGTYVCKEYAETLGEAGIIANGYNFPDWGVSGGSFYMKDGARVDIAAGQLVYVSQLTDNSFIFNVEGTEFVVAGSELGEGIVFDNAAKDQASATEAGKMKHLVTLTQDDTVMATFELFCEPDADITGTYLCKEYAEGLGESLIIANGYNFPDWGVSGGSFYMKDGVRVDINAGELVTVVKAGENLYTFSGSDFTFLAKF